MRTIRIIQENLIDYIDTRSDFISRAHFHTHYEIYYMKEGRRRYFINNEIFDVHSGDIILVPAQVIHKVTKVPESTPEETHKRYLFSPSINMVPPEFIKCFNQYLYHLNSAECRIVEECFLESAYETNHYHSYSECLIKADLIRILKILDNNFQEKKHTKDASQNEIIMEKAANYISKHFSEQLTLEKTAKVFGFSAAHFSVLFKQTTGFNFIEYLINMRIINAINLLKETDLKISEISSRCGYNDSNYFSAVFKKTIGITPLKYRIENNFKKDKF